MKDIFNHNLKRKDIKRISKKTSMMLTQSTYFRDRGEIHQIDYRGWHHIKNLINKETIYTYTLKRFYNEEPSAIMNLSKFYPHTVNILYNRIKRRG